MSNADDPGAEVLERARAKFVDRIVEHIDRLRLATVVLQESRRHELAATRIGLTPAEFEVFLVDCATWGELGAQVEQYNQTRRAVELESDMSRVQEIIAELRSNRLIAYHVAAAFEQWRPN